MADATQGYMDVLYLGPLALVLALIPLIPGLLIHSFIIGVNVSDWWKGRSVTAVDHIITSLGMSRMGVQCVTYLFMIRLFLSSENLDITYVITSAFYTLFSYATVWLTSLLSIVFCLKISNFHSRLFLYLRRMIIHRTGHLIAAFLFISAINVLITLSLTFPKVFSAFLFSSLYHHTTQMKRSSNLSISLEKYYSVMRFIAVTSLYNITYFLGYFVSVFYHYLYCVNLPWLHVVLEFLPVLHSSYLIYTTAKLRSQMSKVLQNVSDFLFQRKDTETRENIEVVGL
ncbi:hypothetical protein PRIEUP_LOCUS264 [Pristimantis euphronides]